MKKIFQENKVAIILFLLSSALTLFSAQLLKFSSFLFLVFSDIGVSLFEWCTNVFCRLAATTDDSSLVVIVFSFVFSFVLVVPFGAFLFPFRRLLSEKDDSDKEPLEERIKNIDKKIAKSLKKTKILAVVSLLLWVVLFVVTTIPYSLYKRFDRDLIVISPYTEKKVVEKMHSDWILMKNKDDFQCIYVKIDSLKKEYKLGIR